MTTHEKIISIANEALREALAALELRQQDPTMYYEARQAAQKACEKIRAAIAEHEREAQALRETAQGYDWSMLEATQESLREHMAMLRQLREAAEKMAEATNYRAAVFAASNDVNKQQFADTKFWEAHDNLDAALRQQAVGINGLTEAETAASASVMGLVRQQGGNV